MSQVKIESIHVYPVKACRGIALDNATVMTEGIRYDREWMIVDRSGRFLTQRERPELARVMTQMDREFLSLSVLGHGRVRVPLQISGWAADAGKLLALFDRSARLRQ